MTVSATHPHPRACAAKNELTCQRRRRCVRRRRVDQGGGGEERHQRRASPVRSTGRHRCEPPARAVRLQRRRWMVCRCRHGGGRAGLPVHRHTGRAGAGTRKSLSHHPHLLPSSASHPPSAASTSPATAHAALQRRVWISRLLAALSTILPQLPHRTFWGELAGLVRDGVSFVAHGGGTSGSAAAGGGGGGSGSGSHGNAGLKAGLLAQGERPDQAPRGVATPLHIAAQLGDGKGLWNLLQGDKRFRPPIDGGDARRYTALHCACAGGHAECAQMLIDAGCDTTLTNDIGARATLPNRGRGPAARTLLDGRHAFWSACLCGWLVAGLTAQELARQLQRGDIMALSFSAAAASPAAAPASAPAPVAAAAAAAQRSPGAAARTSSGGLEESRKLKADLKARGLSAKGSKAELRARLAEAEAAEAGGGS